MKHAAIWVLMAASTIAAAQSADFRWLDPDRDAVRFAEVRRAMESELQPDPPVESTPGMQVKRLERVGVLNDVALALLVGQNEKDAPEWWRAFSYDFRTQELRHLYHDEPDEGRQGMPWFFLLNVEPPAHFEKGVTDIPFEHRMRPSCDECETYWFMHSFRFDADSRAWSVRRFTTQWDMTEYGFDSDAGVLVGAEMQFHYNPEHVHGFACVRAIQDFTGQGVDNLAVRCRETRYKVADQPLQPDKIIRNDMWLYSLLDGRASTVRVELRSELAKKVMAAACKKQAEDALCQEENKASAPIRK